MRFEREEGFVLGVYFMNITLTQLAVVAYVAGAFALTLPDAPMAYIVAGAVVIAVAVPVVCHPVATMLWTGVHLLLQPLEPAEEAEAAAVRFERADAARHPGSLDSVGIVPFASALSEHPLATHAVGEVAGQVLERIGDAPDLAVLFVSAAHTGAMDDIAAAVRSVLVPDVLIGCTASSIVGGGREVEDRPAISLWAARMGAVTPLRLSAHRQDGGVAITGFPAAGELPAGAGAVLLLADPFSFPADVFLEGLRDQVGVGLPVVGGLASAGRGPGGNRLVLDGTVVTDGAVGVVLEGVEVATVVSQGCRPIGDPMTVTRGEHQVVYELAGRPALERVQELVASLGPDDLALVEQGLHVGRVIDEHKLDYGRGDFLIRNVIGADQEGRAVAVGDEVDVGDTLQFQVRDADSADEDLRQLMATQRADAALLFTCNGRGSHLFGVADHDAGIVSEALDGVPVAGMSCAGEIGPVGGHSFLHGFTASVALFSEGLGWRGREAGVTRG